MKIPPILIYDSIVFLIELVISISSIYATWVNLVQKKISVIGFDAFILLFFGKKKAATIREDSRLIRRMGIITFLIAVGTINEAISIFIQKIWPFLH
jgi:hypothetical protein